MRTHLLIVRLSASLAVAALAACGSDTAGNDEDATSDVAADVGADDAGTPDAADAAEEDTQDARDAVDTSGASDVAAEDATVDTGDAAPDATVDTGDAAPDATVDTGDAAPDAGDVALDVTEDVEEDGWTPPDSVLDYPYDAPASIATRLAFAEAGTGLSVDDDATPDNAVGATLSTLGAILGFDAAAELQTSVDDGVFLLGMSWVGGDPDDDLPALEAHILKLSDTDGDPETRDSYTVESETFIPGTAEPFSRFIGSTLAGRFTSEPASLTLPLPLGGFSIDVNVESARIDALIARDELGVAVTEGRIAGIVPGAAIFEGLNAYLASDTCGCLGVAGDVIDIGEQGEGTCVVTDTGACDSADPCAQLLALCAVLANTFTTNYDQDLDASGQNDGMSINLTFEAVGTTLVAGFP